jgi:conjugative relaxase-like TrwC/TraI family protein
VKFYRGSAAAARAYVEADRSRADDYYLAEGTGYAQRYTVTGEGVVTQLPELGGDGYEAWVSGVDPATGEPRGRLRTDEHAVRFAEVVVNGPKSWSIAAELHPDIAAAHEAAQDRAAVQIVAWMGQHAAARVGPRGGQVATHVDRLEAVSVRHYTSRAGDPHRHLHVQINARVEAAGAWRGIDTVAVRNSIEAVHGIGHAAMVCDPQFRAVLAAHGYTLDGDGEVVQLAGYRAAFSKRAAQIGRQVAGYEAEWRAANPGREPGPALRRSWDGRAWAEQRPGKAHTETAGAAHERWVSELAELGYQPPTQPVALASMPVGRLDRDAAAAEVLARLTATRSAWNAADVRGEVELLLARHHIVTDSATRAELAEDLTARAAGECVPLLERVVPDHIRAYTSPAAVVIEDDITGRLAIRGATGGRDIAPERVQAGAAHAGARLDPAQADAVAALAGGHALIVVTGAAGAGKTTTLATVRTVLEADGHRMIVVTPSLKAARTVRRETGARAGSAAWLAFQHGWRWDLHGAWTRLSVGEVDPKTGAAYTGPGEAAQLRAGDLLVVDEAGMADQDTARALLHVVDQHDARLALVGDAHQLAAIGRGGVLDIAARWADRTVTLDVIHRFTRQVEIAPGIVGTVPDEDYAALSLAMRGGANPGDVFDQLQARGQVRVHVDEAALRQAVAGEAAQARLDGRSTAIVVATGEQVRGLNAVIREQLVDAGLVDDSTTTGTSNGERVGVGDVIATRRNDRGADVANRDMWTVTGVHDDGSLSVTGETGGRTLTSGYVREHVELGYASTIHGAQGDTTDTGHLVLDEYTGGAAAYVGMTRGRTANTVHLVAEDLDAARAQWIDAGGRQRADLGVAAAREAAVHAAAGYASPAPTAAADPQRLAQVLDALRKAWTDQAKAEAALGRLRPRLEHAQADAARREQVETRLAPLREQRDSARAAAEAAEQRAAIARAALTQQAEAMHAELRRHWDADRPVAAEAARTVQAGPGRLGRVTGARGDVADAQRLLHEWAEKWRPVQPDLADAMAAARFARQHPGNDRIEGALHEYTARRTGQELPQHMQAIRAAEHADQTARDAATAYEQVAGPARQRETILHVRAGWRDLGRELPRLAEQTAAVQQRLDGAEQRINQLTADPAITSQPDPAAFLTAAHTGWTGDYTAAQAAAAQMARYKAGREAEQAAVQRMRDHDRNRGPSYGPDHGRGGPSIGR